MSNDLKRMIFIGSIVICTIFIAHNFRILSPIESRIGSLFSHASIVGVTLSRGVENTTQKFKKTESTPSQVLEDRIQKLEAENALLTIAKIENDTLREQLQFIRQSKFHAVLANRIGWTTDIRRSGFLIDKGKNDGITIAAPVLTDNGVLVGKISDVQEVTSQITLINDSKSKITAVIAATPPTTGVINGQFGLGLTIDLIPMSEKIDVGNIVETSGLEDGIPAGLLIGTISKLNTQPTDLFQTASVSPTIDYTHIRIVSVLVK